jgi:predicted DNA-binding protein (UPF0251 family)
MEIMGA